MPRKEAIPSLETTGALHDFMATHLRATGLSLSEHPWKEQQKALEAGADLEKAGALASRQTGGVFTLEIEEGLGKVHVLVGKGGENVKVLSATLKPVRKSEDETEKHEFPIEIKTYAIPTEFKPTIDALVRKLKERKRVVGGETALSKPVLPRETIEAITRRKTGQVAFALEKIGEHYDVRHMSALRQNMGTILSKMAIRLRLKESVEGGFEFYTGVANAPPEISFDRHLLSFRYGRLGFPHKLIVRRPEALHLAGVIQDTFKHALPKHKIRIVRDYND